MTSWSACCGLVPAVVGMGRGVPPEGSPLWQGDRERSSSAKSRMSIRKATLST